MEERRSVAAPSVSVVAQANRVVFHSTVGSRVGKIFTRKLRPGRFAQWSPFREKPYVHNASHDNVSRLLAMLMSAVFMILCERIVLRGWSNRRRNAFGSHQLW